MYYSFEPPGAISPGLTCYMNINFCPKVSQYCTCTCIGTCMYMYIYVIIIHEVYFLQTNTDLSGDVELLSETGSIFIPVKCFTKKCLVSIHVDDYR